VNPALFVTVVVVVSVGQPDDVEQPGPLHNAVFDTVEPGGSEASALTWKPRSRVVPAGTPGAIVQVILPPLTATVQGATPLTNGGIVGHEAEPAT